MLLFFLEFWSGFGEGVGWEVLSGIFFYVLCCCCNIVFMFVFRGIWDFVVFGVEWYG